MQANFPERSVVEEKASQYNATVERVLAKVASIRAGISRLKAEEDDLLSKVDIELGGGNPFSEFLARVDSGNVPTAEERDAIVSKSVPLDFGPSEKSFHSLCEEIGRFGPHKREEGKDGDAPDPVNLVLKNLRSVSASISSISVLWDKPEWEDEEESSYFYEIELSVQPSEKHFFHTSRPEYTFRNLRAATEYAARVRVVTLRGGNRNCPWSEFVKARTASKFSDCTWKKCPDNVALPRRYRLDEANPMIVSKIDGDTKYCTVVGDTPIPLNKVSSWNVNILTSLKNGHSIYVGIAPADINQNDDDNHLKCGWYLYLWKRKLCSGPPHKFNERPYGPNTRKNGEYGLPGNSVNVVMNPRRAELSFIIDDKNYGPAYEGIPLDKPLVPCVLLLWKNNSVELEI